MRVPPAIIWSAWLASAAAVSPAAATLPTAPAYIASLYRTMPTRGSYGRVAYTGELARLMAVDAARAEREGTDAALDFDPFCNCQDFATDYHVLRVRALRSSHDMATVVAVIRNDGIYRFAIDLIPKDGRWRVTDIHSAEVPSLLALMRTQIHLLNQKKGA